MKKPEKIILTECLNAMPNIFTSNIFAKKARDLQFPNHLILSGYLGDFLHRYAVQSDTSRRTWYKAKNRIKSVDDIEQIPLIPYPVNNLTPEFCIDFLKKLGYKIMKPIQEWEEL